MSTMAIQDKLGFFSVTLSTSSRDRTQYPDANECVLDMPFGVTFNDIVNIKLVNVEIPSVGYTILTPKVYFSECINKTWYPFVGYGASANYSTTGLMYCVAHAMTYPLLLSGPSSIVSKNTYSVAASDDQFGRYFITSDGKVPYNLHLRYDPVKVLSAVVDATNADRVVLTISDGTSKPLLPGAFCKLNVQSTSPIYGDVVVQAVTTSTVTVTSTSVWSVTAGEQLSIVNTSTLVPYAADSNLLAGEVGYGMKADKAGGDPVLICYACSPFLKEYDVTEGLLTTYVTTHEPMQPTVGDYMRIAGTGSFLDGQDASVTSVSTDNLFKLQVSSQSLLTFYAGLRLLGSLGGVYTVYSMDMAYIQDNVFRVTMVLDNALTSSVGDFAVDSTFKLHHMIRSEMNDMTFTVTSSQLLTPTQLEVIGETTYFQYGFTDGSVVLLGSTAGTAEDGSAQKLATKTVAPYHYDPYQRNRVLFLEILVNGTDALGGIYYHTFGSKRFFARMVFVQGINTLNYLDGVDNVDEVTLERAIGNIRCLKLTLYEMDGNKYDLAGLDFTMNFLFKKTHRAL